MQMVDQESRRMIWEREELGEFLEKLYRLKTEDKYGLYTLLSHYDTEILLYMMARVNNEKIKRMISNYFTKLKNTKIMLSGKDLKGMGVKPGPIYKEIFDSLLKARLNNLIRTKDDEAGFVKEMFENHLEGA
jgi:tRNA nucleotidyltransferase (CCA-adding enzyme)